MRWLCAVKGTTTTCNVFKRAVCTAIDAFAECGAGEVGNFQIGECLGCSPLMTIYVNSTRALPSS